MSTTEEESAEEPAKSWANSESKALLRSGIISGAIPATMKPKLVYDMNREIHGVWKYDNWANNLRNLRNAIKRDRGRMARDAVSYGQTQQIARRLFPLSSSRKPVWHLSEAKALLTQDVNEGKHTSMTPKQLHQSRSAYKVFDLSVFRKHIYQEVDSRPKREIRFEKKKSSWKYPELHTNHPRLRNDEVNIHPPTSNNEE